MQSPPVPLSCHLHTRVCRSIRRCPEGQSHRLDDKTITHLLLYVIWFSSSAIIRHAILNGWQRRRVRSFPAMFAHARHVKLGYVVVANRSGDRPAKLGNDGHKAVHISFNPIYRVSVRRWSDQRLVYYTRPWSMALSPCAGPAQSVAAKLASSTKPSV